MVGVADVELFEYSEGDTTVCLGCGCLVRNEPDDLERHEMWHHPRRLVGE